MFPKIENLQMPEIIEQVSATKTVEDYTSYAFDFEEVQFIKENGKLIKLYGIDALKVWIYDCIKTEFRKSKVYEDVADFGTNKHGLIGYTLNGFIKEEIKREVKVALEQHFAIKTVNVVDVYTKKSKLYVKCEIKVITRKGLKSSDMEVRV
ncbi:DUF2634 domain-containing protein [Anaerophilus nitritogenes]|uniref:DUF2634 domain-containing protein n=1 Tax=Anaerophilus nitritogenes TaxID=2498136 RepID=UPI00101C661A|nr:DUF2634 domain-containing protein [Anaerophilus nitritogenes]